MTEMGYMSRSLHVNAKDEIVEAWKRHLSSGMSEPTQLKLPLAKAYDLCKLGREELGRLSCELLHYGPRHLERTGLFGIMVKITDGTEIAFE